MKYSNIYICLTLYIHNLNSSTPSPNENLWHKRNKTHSLTFSIPLFPPSPPSFHPPGISHIRQRHPQTPKHQADALAIQLKNAHITKPFLSPYTPSPFFEHPTPSTSGPPPTPHHTTPHHTNIHPTFPKPNQHNRPKAALVRLEISVAANEAAGRLRGRR